MKTKVSILIPSGAIVQGRNGFVTLRGDVYIDAVRLSDGSYAYDVCGEPYITCAAVVEVLTTPTYGAMSHRDGLVAFGV